MQTEHFFPQIQVKTKKGLFQKLKHFFSPNSGEDQKKGSSARAENFFPQFALSCTPFQIIGGDAEVNHFQTIGEKEPNFWGDISPHPPGFRHHCIGSTRYV